MDAVGDGVAQIEAEAGYESGGPLRRQFARRGYRGRRGRLAVAGSSLMAFNPQATLARGFAIVRGPDGELIRSVVQARPGAPLRVQVSDGVFGATVDG